MHVATGLIVALAVWRWVDWRNWQKYHTTMLYFALGNMMYHFFTANYYLWRLEVDKLSNYSITELIYTLVVFPGTALLFLSNFPQEKRSKKIKHIVIWIGIYAVWEAVFTYTDSIVYQYGWGYWWSVGFDAVMFPMLLLHHRKPLIAYALSGIIGTALIWYFDVPIHIPIEGR